MKRLISILLTVFGVLSCSSPVYDVVVVGGGPAGIGAALAAAKAGARTALIERDSRVGGTTVQAEVCDMGLYLIWQTPAWTREGEGWNVDIARYPVYMREVYNHPSIVMWEAGNHPNWFLQHGPRETQDYMAAVIPAIARTDSSRLISPPTGAFPFPQPPQRLSFHCLSDCCLVMRK